MQRWKEELTLVGYEMRWSLNYFKYQSQLWMDRQNAALTKNEHGAAAYASRKVAMWIATGTNAEKDFHAANPEFKLITN